MSKQRARLSDIARKTGFSSNTVSLALRDSPRIPEATREVIRRAARDMNYLPNRIAQSLVSRQSMTIGLVLTDISNPILTQVAQEISAALSDRGYATLFATSNNTMPREIEVIDTFRARQVDGILIYPTDHRQTGHALALREMGYPIVSLVADPDKALDTVSIDEQEGARKATRHLLSTGRNAVAILDASAPLGNLEKRTGYRQALADAGVDCEPWMVVEVNGHGMETGYRAMTSLWAQASRPDAILATNDSLALGVLRWCEDNRVQVPQDLAIVGFDDIEFARFSSISTVAYPVDRIAGTAVNHLLSLIHTEGPLPPAAATLLDPSLLVRRSSDSTAA